MKQPYSVDIKPTWPGPLTEVVPLAMLTLALTRLIEAIRRNHPEVLGRIGVHAADVFLIDPVNLPIVFRVQPKYGAINCLHRSSACTWDARIAGPIGTLLAMVHGTLDGDALFFSRDITIEGDTEAILALRNAIDAAEIDLTSEFAALFGPFRLLANASMRTALLVAERVTGLSLFPQKVQTR